MLGAKIKIKDEGLLNGLIATEGYFERQKVQEGRAGEKARDCLKAIELLKQNKPILLMLAVRIVGQLPPSGFTRDLFKALKKEAEENCGITFVDCGGSIMTMPYQKPSGGF